MTAPSPEFGELYDRYSDEFLACARALVDDFDEAEDLVHDAFLILLKRSGGGAQAGR